MAQQLAISRQWNRRNDWIERLRMAWGRGRLGAAVYSRIRPYLVGSAYIFSPSNISIHCPGYMEPESADERVVERIFESYLLMKKDQQFAGRLYQPAPHWQMILARYPLASLKSFHHFLANFGAWKTDLGVSHGSLIHSMNRSAVTRRYCERSVFLSQLRLWQQLNAGAKAITRLSYPQFGNQAGAFIDGAFVGAGSFDNEAYGSMLGELVADCEKPLIAELGAGHGKLAYFILRDLKDFAYIDYDLPEVLCLAAYYLTKAFPQKSAMFYGEPASSSDLSFLPAWEIENLLSKSADLFINKNSLGEMQRDAALNYVSHIARTARYFFHLNHERQPQAGSGRGLCANEYPVTEAFSLLSKHKDAWNLAYQGQSSDIFAYLYQRRD